MLKSKSYYPGNKSKLNLLSTELNNTKQFKQLNKPQQDLIFWTLADKYGNDNGPKITRDKIQTILPKLIRELIQPSKAVVAKVIKK
jgi:hypothetical protein